MKPVTYESAGVDIEAGHDLVKRLTPYARATSRPGASVALGGFASLIDPKAAGFHDPLILASTDGVGTKLSLALECDAHETIGLDLVAMCVNDLLTQGATPLAFLDYFACGRLEPSLAASVIQGIARGCQQAGCALVGGETAEMPGCYQGRAYDIAGFVIGAVERHERLEGRVRPGDVLLGVPSCGVHANGFSLIRKLIHDKAINVHAPAPFDPSRTLAEVLLTPTRLYTDLLPFTELLHGMSHITGGGLYENVPRAYGDHLAATMTRDAWPHLPVFQWIAEESQLSWEEMYHVFNCGVGMVLMVPPENVSELTRRLAKRGESVFTLGTMQERVGPPLVIEGM